MPVSSSGFSGERERDRPTKRRNQKPDYDAEDKSSEPAPE